MAYGNNRAAKQARAHFQLAGGSSIKFRHPYLAGQIDTDGAVDEIDISACCKLEGRFFEANQNQDSAKQVVLVDGSVVTISNKLLNGTITMPVVKTTGLVATGDFIAALQLIRTLGDSVGGLLYKTDYVNGKAITKLFYGVTPQRVPDDVSEGNDVAVYNIQLLYAGWIEAVSTSTSENKKRIWAVGNQQGLEAYFSPYVTQNASTGDTAVVVVFQCEDVTFVVAVDVVRLTQGFQVLADGVHRVSRAGVVEQQVVVRDVLVLPSGEDEGLVLPVLPNPLADRVSGTGVVEQQVLVVALDFVVVVGVVVDAVTVGGRDVA